MEIKLVNIIAAIINFGILYFILKKYLFNRITVAINNRKDEIKLAFNNIEKNQNELQEQKHLVEREIKELKEKGEQIFSRYKQTAEKNREGIIEEAKKDAKNIIDKAHNEIEREKKFAEEEMKKTSIDLSVDICAKVLQDTLDEETHKKIIKNFISKVGQI